MTLNWGVPDWRDAPAYPKPDEFSDTEWRWEFLRRRPDYREDWLKWAARDYRDYVQECESRGEKPHAMDCCAYRVEMPDFSSKYGLLFGLQNPALHEPAPDLFRETLVGELIDTVAGVLPAFLHEEGHIALLFDLNKPIQLQLKQAERRLFARQEEHVGILRERRRHKSKWPTYLRAIDARDAGETFEAIGKVFFGEADENRMNQTEFDAAIRDDSTIAARMFQIWKQGQDLIFNFPA